MDGASKLSRATPSSLSSSPLSTYWAASSSAPPVWAVKPWRLTRCCRYIRWRPWARPLRTDTGAAHLHLHGHHRDALRPVTTAGQDLSKQLVLTTFFVLGAMLFLLSLIPGMPTIPLGISYWPSTGGILHPEQPQKEAAEIAIQRSNPRRKRENRKALPRFCRWISSKWNLDTASSRWWTPPQGGDLWTAWR